MITHSTNFSNPSEFFKGKYFDSGAEGVHFGRVSQFVEIFLCWGSASGAVDAIIIDECGILAGEAPQSIVEEGSDEACTEGALDRPVRTLCCTIYG